ncbi:carbohydrate ABC transporter permease [Demequina lutea]|uniref:Multiple sugar transport system permease protein n=1 Tax=Demequina lutea TaxID=431489 RepID=A0A7Y9ZFH4_9MICO|nr:sugar ABC transporter permease [Demequina lutea]NYI42431.1 multiple sugar transport system permease protein [Demequina lutea]
MTTVAPSGTGAGTKNQGRALVRRRQRRRRTKAPYFLVAPALILFILFTVIPIGYAIRESLYAQRVTGGGVLGTRTTVFVGFENYIKVLTDPQMLSGLRHVLIFGFIAVPATLGLALLFALLLDTPGVRLTRFGRTSIFVPYAVPGVVAALLWGFMYLPRTSPFSYITEHLGLGTIPFLESGYIYLSMANISIWGGVGFNMLVIFTALQGLPRELIEAARLDGATEVGIAFRVKMPLVRPALILTSVFALLGAIQLYGEPIMLKPLTTSISDTWTPLLTIYRNAFRLDNLNEAAAASVVLAVAIIFVSIAVLQVVRVNARRGM